MLSWGVTVHVCIGFAVIGCCFHGLCKVVTIYVHRSSNYDWVHWI